MTVPAPAISAVLPAYNEVAVIASTVRRTHAAMQECGIRDFEIVVVDDGSNDGTGEAVRALSAALAGVRVVDHERNRGYGAALRTGFESATREAVFLMDSDGQFDPADLALLLPHYAADTVVAGDRVHRNDTLVRRANNRAFFALV